jgi:hypothetical protein
MTEQFQPKNGMSYVMKKKIVDCTQEEKEYKQAYGRWLYERYKKKHNILSKSKVKKERKELTEEEQKEKIIENRKYRSEYYNKNRERCLQQIKEGRRKRRIKQGLPVYSSPGRPPILN